MGFSPVDFGEDIEAEVAAAFGPFVVLFRENCADASYDGVAVREDTAFIEATRAVRNDVGLVRPAPKRWVARAERELAAAWERAMLPSPILPI